MELIERQMRGRRERILEAAREIIGERGFEGLTMRELAAASRVTVPTVYNLVGSKEAVLFAAVEEQTERFVAALEKSRGEGLAAGALTVVDACVREMLRRPRYYRSLLMLIFASEAAADARREVNGVLREQFSLAVEELHAEGHLAEWVDREALARRLGAHVAFTSLQWATGALTAEAFRASALYDACLTLLGACEGSTRRELVQLARDLQDGTAPRRRRSSGNGRPRASGRRS